LGVQATITAFVALNHLVRGITTPAEAALEEVEVSLRSEPSTLATLTSEIETLVNAHFPEGTDLALDEAVIGPYENMTVGFLGDFKDVTVDDAREEPGGPVHVFLTARGHLSIDAFVYKADFYALDLDEEQFLVIDSDWNDHYVYGSVERELEVQVEATWDGDHLSKVSVRDVDDAVAATLDPHGAS
jgi:hypothetical protein